MHKKNFTSASKHSEFVSFMRNMIASSEQDRLSSFVLDNDDAENEMNTALMLELERLFGDLFDSID